jgi:hypothetical protein
MTQPDKTGLFITALLEKSKKQMYFKHQPLTKTKGIMLC